MTTRLDSIRTRHSVRRCRRTGVAGLVVVCAMLVGCGDDTSTSSTATNAPATSASASPTGSEQLCADRDALKSSIDDLTNVDIAKSGTSGLQAAVDQVKGDLGSLRKSAAGEFDDQVQAMEKSLGELETAVKNVSSGGERAVVTAAANVAASGQALLQSLQDIDCS